MHAAVTGVVCLDTRDVRGVSALERCCLFESPVLVGDGVDAARHRVSAADPRGRLLTLGRRWAALQATAGTAGGSTRRVP